MMQNFLQKNKNIILFILIIMVVIISTYIMSYHKFLENKKQYTGSLSEKNIEKLTSSYENITNGMTIKKQFIAHRNNLNEIKVFLAKRQYGKIDIDFKLTNITDNVIIYEKNISFKDIELDSEYILKFDMQKESKNKTYELLINFNSVGKSELGIGYSNKKMQKDASIFVNSKEIDGTFGINELYTSKRKIKNFNLISLITGTIVLIYSIFIFTRKKVTPEKLYIYIIPIISIIYMLVLPMYAGHDEVRHVLRIYEISDGHFLTQINDDKVGTPLPKKIADGLKKDWREGVSYEDIDKIKEDVINKEETKITNMENVAVYSPIQYIPQSVGMVIAKLFTNNLLIILYAARILNLLICIVLMYFAIKKMPFGKMFVFIIAILPLSIEGMSTMSPDGLTISIVTLFIAYILDIIYNNNIKTVKTKDILILTVLSVIIALCKIVYIPIVAMLLLIPKEKYNSKYKKTYITLGIMLFAIIINLIWLKISNNYLSITSNGDSEEKIRSILKAPIGYLGMMLYTINYNGSRYIEGTFGSVMAMGELVKLYTIVPITFLGLFIYNLVTDKSLEQKFNKWQNFVMIIIVLIILGLIFTSLYVQNTQIESMTIDGVQGRYFIPFILLIGLLLSNFKIKVKEEEDKRIKLIGIISVIIQMYIVLSIIITHLE